MAKTADLELRADYKAALIDVQATLARLDNTSDRGLEFWVNELRTVTARHLAKLGAVEAKRQHLRPETTDPTVLERNAAIVAADAAGRSLRTARREDRDDAKEAWGRLEACERERDELRGALETARSQRRDATDTLDSAGADYRAMLGQIATLTSEREYWEARCLQAEGFVIDGEPAEDPRVVAAFAGVEDLAFFA